MTRLREHPAVCCLCESSVADMTADPNDRLKLLTEQGGWTWCVCVLDRERERKTDGVRV